MNLPHELRERIASHLGPANRARLAATSHNWRSASLVTPQESARGQFEHQLRKVLLAAAMAVKQRIRSYSDRKRGSERMTIGGYGPRHGGLRAEISGNLRWGWHGSVSSIDAKLLEFDIDLEGDHVEVEVSRGWGGRALAKDLSIARKVFRSIGWKVV